MEIKIKKEAKKIKELSDRVMALRIGLHEAQEVYGKAELLFWRALHKNYPETKKDEGWTFNHETQTLKNDSIDS